MKKIALIILVIFSSCSPKLAPVATTEKVTPKNDVIDSQKIIANNGNNKLEFSSLYIKADVDYSDEKQSHNVSAEIKILKDKQILVSVRFLGITMAKANITPQSVSYYEKLGSSYFEGDFSSLSAWLGTDLDFSKIQNLLLGRAIDNLEAKKMVQNLENGVYKLDIKTEDDFKKAFYFDANSFMLTKQEVTQTSKNRMIAAEYSKMTPFKEGVLPLEILLNAMQAKGKSRIKFEYTSASFNEELSFPYSIPSGYKKINK